MELSRDSIAKAIRSNLSTDDAAAEIWEAVAAYILKSENRIIDAEFALQELKSKSEERPLAL